MLDKYYAVISNSKDVKGGIYRSWKEIASILEISPGCIVRECVTLEEAQRLLDTCDQDCKAYCRQYAPLIKRTTIYLYTDVYTSRYGTIIVPVTGKPIKLSGHLIDNNELLALAEALKYVDDAIIYTNSVYIPECVNKHLLKWKKRNWEDIGDSKFLQTAKQVLIDCSNKVICFKSLCVNNYYSPYEKEVMMLADVAMESKAR